MFCPDCGKELDYQGLAKWGDGILAFVEIHYCIWCHKKWQKDTLTGIIKSSMYEPSFLIIIDGKFVKIRRGEKDG